MIKVFLVEDEIVVREGIKKKIKWKEEGFEFVGEANDGELAFPLIEKLMPDIIITDIHMPFVDGLELSRMVKKKFPHIKIIIISGHGEFEYAKKAIEIGVTDYLLKPITAEQLVSAIKNVANKIIKEREQEDLYKKYKAEMEEIEIINKRRLFEDIVLKKVSMQEILVRSEQLNIHLMAVKYRVVLFQLSVTEEESSWDTMVNLVEDAKEYMDRFDAIEWFDRTTEGYAMIYKSDAIENNEEELKAFIGGLERKVSKQSNMRYFIGIGISVERISEIYKSFEEANRVFSYRFIEKQSNVLWADDIGNEGIDEKRNIDVSLLNIDKMDKDIILNFLKSGTQSNIPMFVDEYLQGIGLDNLNSLLFSQYLVLNFYFVVLGFCERLNEKAIEETKPFGNINDIEKYVESLESVKEYIFILLEEALKIRDQNSKKKYEELISLAKTHIKEHYFQENISLHTVAKKVNISPSYFSTIFSQEVGKTFIEYLTQVRMEKAKELLMCSNKKTSEIGFEVGYQDAHYFSFLFKKTQNCSPREFRMRRDAMGGEV